MTKSLKLNGDPYGIRTRVAGVKGQCPRPLDEGVACLLEGWDCLRDRIGEIKTGKRYHETVLHRAPDSRIIQV